MRKLAIPVLAAFTMTLLSLPAFAGPGACVQTLIAIQQSAHGGWLKGVAPSLVRGVKGHNDVVLLQRKDGSFIVNEGSRFFSLPVQLPLKGKGSLLTSTLGEGSIRKHSILETQAARIVTPQGNEVDLHFVGTDESKVPVLRSRYDDQASLESAIDSTKRGGEAANNLAEKSIQELKLCEEGTGNNVGSLVGSIGDIVRAPGQATAAETDSAKKRGLQNAVEEFTAQKKASQAELAELDKLAKQMASNETSLASNKLSLYDLPTKDVDAVLAEVTNAFSDKMSDNTISDTDRAEIAKECGDGVKLPERKATATEKIKASICDGMPAGQKQVCQMVMKNQ